MKYTSFITVFFFTLLVTLANTETAQARTGLSVDPAIVKIQIKPGKAITKAFTIQNNSDTKKELVVRLVPFEKADINGNPIIDIKNNSPWKKYITLSNTNIRFDEPFILDENSKEQIVLSISIPENANIEDFYATLLFSTYSNETAANSEGTIISASIGANLLVTTTQQADPKTIVKIDNIQIISPNHLKIGRRIYADSLTPLVFQITANNAGNHITETKGTVTVTKNEEVLSQQGILAQNIISKSTRQLLDKNGNKSFTFKPSMTSFGSHKINVHIKSENTNSSNSIEVFIFPAKLIIGLIIAIVLAKNIFKFSNKPVDTNI